MRQDNPDYYKFLNSVQEKLNTVFWKLNQNADLSLSEAAEIMKPTIAKYIQDNKVELPPMNSEELTDRLFLDLKGYSILTVPIADDDVEGIDINAWNNVIVNMRGGKKIRVNGFCNEGHCKDIINKLLRPSKQTLNSSSPKVGANIGINTRMVALCEPLVGKGYGAVAYIRKLSKEPFTTEKYLGFDFAAEEELDQLVTMFKRGGSTLIVGKVDTGKTTLLAYIMDQLPSNFKKCTIEQDASEFDLRHFDEFGNPTNSVVHMLSSLGHPDPSQDITQEALVELMLRLNVDYGSVAEMRNAEAYAAQEASLAGNPIISTAHAGTPRQGHKRVASLSRKRYPTDSKDAMENACEAFPLVVYIHKLEDKRRRIMNITECEVDDDGGIHYHTLWQYDVEINETIDGQAVVKGTHHRVGEPSERLIARMKQYGLSRTELESMRL